MRLDTRIRLSLCCAAVAATLMATGCGEPLSGPLLAILTGQTPVVLQVTIKPDTVLPGDPFSVSYTATGGRGLRLARVVYQPAPGVVYVDTAYAGGEVSFAHTAAVPALEPATGAGNATVVVEAIDENGAKSSLDAVIHFRPPAHIFGGIRGPCFPPNAVNAALTCWNSAVPGDTLLFSVIADNTTGLAWAGYYIGAPVNIRDSIAVSGTQVSDTFRVTVDPRWITGQPDSPSVTVFVRDKQGHRTGLTFERFIGLLRGPRRPALYVPLHGLVHDVALDTVRGLLYLTQPDSDRILRLSIATMTFDSAPIAISGRPNGVDLSLGGDSLLVAIWSTSELGIVNLQTHAVSRAHIGRSIDDNWGPDYLQQASNGKVLVAGTIDGVIEYDLTTGEQHQRLETNYDGRIVPMGDRTRLALQSQVYFAAADSLSGQLIGYGGPQSFDRAGRYMLVRSSLWSLDPIGFIRDYAPNWAVVGAGSTVISPDGTLAFFASEYGYFTVSLSDGTTLDDVPVTLAGSDNRIFQWLIPLPDGRSLIGVGVNGAARIDLTSPAPAARRKPAAVPVP